MPQLNEEQQKDCADRIESFKKEYEKLCLSHQVEIMTFPSLEHMAHGMFGVLVKADFVDLKYRNPSPIHAAKN